MFFSYCLTLQDLGRIRPQRHVSIPGASAQCTILYCTVYTVYIVHWCRKKETENFRSSSLHGKIAEIEQLAWHCFTKVSSRVFVLQKCRRELETFLFAKNFVVEKCEIILDLLRVFTHSVCKKIVFL